MRTLKEIKEIGQEFYIKMIGKGMDKEVAKEATELTYQINVLSTTPKDHKRDKELKEEFDRICKEEG